MVKSDYTLAHNVQIQADPEALEIDLRRTAVVVVDMQNAYIKKGGMSDLNGRDISESQRIIKPVQDIIAKARLEGVKIVFLAIRYSPDLRESGGSDSPNWIKHYALRMYREHPEWREKLLIRGTWGAEIIDELKPEKDDIVVEKTRFSGFFGTNLDIILQTYNIKYLVFVGLATNRCVEASIIDAYSLGYFPILVSDATARSGPAITQEAAVFNVKNAFGWVTTASEFTGITS